MARLPVAGVVGTAAEATVPRGTLELTEPTSRAITRPTRTAPSWTTTPQGETSTPGRANPVRSHHTEVVRRGTIMDRRGLGPSRRRIMERNGARPTPAQCRFYRHRAGI